MTDWKQKIESFVVEAAEKADDQGLLRRPRVGFSSPDDPLFDEIIRRVGPHHLHPRDILPEVRTVTSFFIPFSKTVVEANRKEKPVARLWGQTYLKVNALINHISESLAAMVRAEGGQAALVPATYGFDPLTLKADWSHRSAALVAGLGRFGLNRMLIGPDGGAGRYGTVFISEFIEPGPKQEQDYCLYLKNGSCRVCLEACPVGALTVDGFDGLKCYARCKSNSEALNFDGGRCDVCGKCVTAGPCAIK